MRVALTMKLAFVVLAVVALAMTLGDPWGPF